MAKAATCLEVQELVTKPRTVGLPGWVAIMYVELSALLGAHLHPTTKDIWWDEFADVFSLLPGEPKPKPWATGIPFLRKCESYWSVIGLLDVGLHYIYIWL